MEYDIMPENKLVVFKQINEVLNLLVYNIEKLTHEVFSDLHEIFRLSAVGYEIGDDNDQKKIFLLEKLVNLCYYIVEKELYFLTNDD